jgi:hypothetical protein
VGDTREPLLDDLVGAGHERVGERETQRLCGLEVDRQLEAGRSRLPVQQATKIELIIEQVVLAPFHVGGPF